MKLLKGYIFAILSAVIYGLMPLMASYIYADGVNAMTLVLLRNLLALPVLAILAFCQQRSLKVPVKSLPGTAFLAAFGTRKRLSDSEVDELNKLIDDMRG